ncbi:MAG: 3-oxo-5a-steroid 4- dehydrogenase [Vezdaea aestivalis]|nr:MAG: 3-oxo-5a-steroid 4- dehydrogenase [Vezdaea aestivalis]
MSTSEITLSVRPRGKPVKKMPEEVTVPLHGPTSRLYKALAAASGLSIHQLRVTKGSDGSLVTASDEVKLEETGLRDQSSVYVKDLGPQLDWQFVFLIEYLGPIVIHPIIYFLRPWIYGTSDPPSQVQTIALWLVVGHFVKRELETLFVHRFSLATMPASNAYLKNWPHYWFLAGLNLAYWVYSPSAPAAKPLSPLVTYPAVAVFLISELQNLSAHLTLRGLRSAGGTERGIPQGWSFDLVTCPNYMWETFAWLGFVALTRSWSAGLFAIVAVGQMAIWAKGKEGKYRREFGQTYKRKRYAGCRKTMDKRRKRVQQPATYYESEGEDSGDWASPKPAQRDLSSQTGRASRSRRNATTSNPTSVTVERALSSPVDSTKKSMHLTVKTSANKLREVTGENRRGKGAHAKDDSEPAEPVAVPRASRSKRAVVEESDSDELPPSSQLDSDINDYMGPQPWDAMEEVDSDDEEEDEDADGDVDMVDAPAVTPPAPAKSTAKSKPTPVAPPTAHDKTKTVVSNQMELDDDDDDDELSELESEEEEVEEDAEEEDAEGEVEEEEEEDAEGEADEDDEEEEIEVEPADEDAEGEEDMEVDEEGAEVGEEEDEEEGEDSDGDATPATGSRASTPDYAKLTKRQRGRVDQIMGDHLLELPLEPKAKKLLTAEEHLMRRTEMARRRKNLSEKRNEEEKMDTINKLLKKQAPKRRGRVIATDTAGDMTPMTQELEFEKPKSTMIRWVSNREGIRVGVPEEWLGTPAGRVFEPAVKSSFQPRRMVEETE